MNKKGNTAWILCSSKSFPGKLYYFNVTTGEAAWCLTDEEKKTLVKDVAIRKVSDRSHCYPEPNTPPAEEEADNASICYNLNPTTNIPLNYHMGVPQIFGQPVFSQYTPGYMIPRPQMFVSNKPEIKKRSFDQITQTSDDQVTGTQNYTIPLSKRFGAYRQVNMRAKTLEYEGKCISAENKGHMLATNTINGCNTDSFKVKTGTIQGSIFGPTLNCHNIFKECTSEHNPFSSYVNNASNISKSNIIKDPDIFSINRNENNNIHNFTIKNSNQKPNVIQKSMLTEIKTARNQQTKAKSVMNLEIGDCLTKPVFKSQYSNVIKDNCVQNCADVPKQTGQKLFLYANKDIISPMCETYEMKEDTDKEKRHLNSNDLRYVLQAKRRKRKFSDAHTIEQNKDIFPSTSKHFNNELNKLKDTVKQVTFNFENLTEVKKKMEAPTPEESVIQDSENVNETNSLTPQLMDISYLKRLAKSFLKTDPWYMVVDIGVLLEDFEFIENFVKKDITCKLLVPNSVRSYIETMSMGEYGGRSWVMLARKAMRRLAVLGNHIVLQSPKMEKSSTSAIDGTIECCLQVLRSNHTVLITTYTELYNKAVALDINTYRLDDIKRNVENEPQTALDIGINVKIKNDNIFMQNTDHLDEGLFKNDVATTVKINQRKSLENKVDDSNPTFSNKSNIVTGATSVNKIQLGQSKINVKKKVDSNIEDDIRLLSIHENLKQNMKSSDNFKAILQRYPDLNIRKTVINTNIQKNDTKDEKVLENPKAVRGRGLFGDIFPNRPIDLRHGLAQVSSTSQFGFKDRPLTVTAPVKLHIKNPSIIEGHRLKLNAYTMKDLLKRFHDKSGRVSKRIESRLDEWLCCFYQIMEECLTGVLMNKTREMQSKLSAPWTLPEAALCLQEVYSDNTAIKAIADELCNVLTHLSDRDDNLKNKMKSIDFMKLFGCGVLMVESLKSILPQSAQILESEKRLNQLLHHIEDPCTDTELPLAPSRLIPSEIDDTASVNRNIVPKKPSEVIRYLKLHFPAWKDVDERHLPAEYRNKQKKFRPNENAVVRTLGKNLIGIRINNAKQITFDNTSLYDKAEFKENIVSEKELAEITRTVDNIQTNTEKMNTKDISYNDVNEHTNQVSAFKVKNDNTKVVTPYKNWKDSEIDDESLDYEDSALDNVNFDEGVIRELDDNAVPFIDDGIKLNNDDIQNDADISLFDETNDKTIEGDDKENSYDTMTDSGFVNQSLDACSFIRLFLAELGASFKLIYSFINDCIREFRNDAVQQENKRLLYDKANETHLYVADIIGKLRQIVDREANEKTKLKCLIINAGVEALTDKRMTRYRQVTMKCLEQAQLLEGALKTMLALTNEHCDITALNTDNADYHVPYLNIFE